MSADSLAGKSLVLGRNSPTGVSALPVFVALLLLFGGLQFLIPLRTAVQIGADEGFELTKTTLCLKGYKLYSEVWNDQPPLHTFLITQVLKYLTPSVLGPRLVTVGFAALLLVSVFLMALHSGAGVSPAWAEGQAGRKRTQGKREKAFFLSLRSVRSFAALLCGGGVNSVPLWTAGLATALLIASPGFLELSSSCMLEIPALATALAGLCALWVLPRTRWYAAECLAGILFGIAALMKLVPLYLLPLAAMIVWLRQRALMPPLCASDVEHPKSQSGVSPVPHQAPHSKTSRRFRQPMQTSPSERGGRFVSFALFVGLKSLRSLLVPLLLMGISLAASFVAVDWLIERGAFLVHFQQSWSSHFGGVQSFEYGSPGEHAFDWSILLKNWDLAVPAVVGVCVLITRLREKREAIFPLAWLALSLIVFTNHQPWWSDYYIHIAIPLCWCAAVGIVFVGATLVRGCQRTRRESLRSLCSVRSFVALLFALCASAWMGTRVYLQIAGVRNAPQLYTALVLKEIERLKPFAKWMYTDQTVYSFHAGIPMPPPLAVMPLKRLWVGEMTNARIAAEMSQYKPEIILLRNDTREVPFQNLLDTEYRVIYQDDRQRLYAERTTIKRADAAERSVGRGQ